MTQIPEEIFNRITKQLQRGGRVILGIAGPPGCGKSTLAAYIAQHFNTRAAVLPMDGYHLANTVLDARGLRHCKGAPETFDAAGFAAILARVAHPPQNETIYAPDFDRTLDAAIAGSIAIPPDCDLLVTEGNYLLCDGIWGEARRHMHDVWYLDVADSLRREWLIERHISFGRTLRQASDWVAQTDAPNARYVASFKNKADWIVPSSLLAKLY